MTATVEVEVLQPLNHDLVLYEPGQRTWLPQPVAEHLAGIEVVKILTTENPTETTTAKKKKGDNA